MKFFKFSLMAAAAAFALLGMNAWVVADGPIADFPEYIKFSPNESPEGVAVDKVGNVYVSVLVSNLFSQHDEIWKFSPTGESTLLARFETAERVGLAVDAMGNVYIARHGAGAGVYVVDQDGVAILLPGTEEMYYADGLAFDKRGNLYITDLVSLDSSPGSCMDTYGQGGIYRFPKGGTEAEPWLYHELLTGDCPGILGFPAGANGIQFHNGDLYVINTDKGTIVRVPVEPDGSPGEPTIWATLQPVPESPLTSMGFPALGDGLAFDVHGNAYVAVVSQSAIVRINALDMSQETIKYWPLAPLDTPTSFAFGTGKGGRTSIFVANMGWMAMFGIPNPPGPSFMKFDVGVPGFPLP